MSETHAEIQPSPDQVEALSKMEAWISEAESSEENQFRLGGLAGTGKTTLIKKFIENHTQDLWPAVVSLTGKACAVLISKGISAYTIHSTIYYADTDSSGFLNWTRRDREDVHGNMFIVDEASMVNAEIYQDLVSYGFPILWVGDHGQLEPIGESPDLMNERHLDARLDRIHRQAEKNPIIKFAHALREGRVLEDTPDARLRVLTQYDAWKECDLTSFDQIICGFNDSRVKINKKIRHLLGREGILCEGDRIICLKNNRRVGVFNGLQAVVTKVREVRRNRILADVLTDLGDEITVEMVTDTFHCSRLPEKYKARSLYETTVWDYGYGITCHKSQGSEWKSVLVFEEMSDKWNPRRWSYTAATRASETLVYATSRQVLSGQRH